MKSSFVNAVYMCCMVFELLISRRLITKFFSRKHCVPDDDVQGEMVFLQARMLDNAAMVLKHRSGKFSLVYVFFLYHLLF